MSFRVSSTVPFDRLKGVSKSGLMAAITQAKIGMADFVPYKEGHLRSDVQYSDGGEIIYRVPYATSQFYGVSNGSRIRNYTTDGTSRRWDLRMKADPVRIGAVKNAYVKGANL